MEAANERIEDLEVTLVGEVGRLKEELRVLEAMKGRCLERDPNPNPNPT